ncbi:uncharacterized protein JCM6883_000900 [Sporobolomyces salmoneus]|uniref:uncharacterized protein n=1 Tax=Sporobolomyces salmoneus TaxID=183962 RepID=UPI00316FDF93
MPSSRRSISVPPRCQTTPTPRSTPSTFDDPALVSGLPATPVYGRHTGLESYVPEGFPHTLKGYESLKQNPTKPTEVRPQVVTTQARPASPAIDSLHRAASPAVAHLKAALSSTRPPPQAPPPPLAKTDYPPSPPSPKAYLHHAEDDYLRFDPNPINPQALPLPSPPLEGEYLFPDPTGRATLLPHPNPNRIPSRRVSSIESVSSPASRSDLDSPLPSHSKSPPSLSASSSNSSSQQRLVPSAPKLEPTRTLAPSPPSGTLSQLSGSAPVSPNFELERPFFEHWTSVQPGDRSGGEGGAAGVKKGVMQLDRGGGPGGRGRGARATRSAHHSPSPLRGGSGGISNEGRELEKAQGRIRELEREVEALKKEMEKK